MNNASAEYVSGIEVLRLWAVQGLREVLSCLRFAHALLIDFVHCQIWQDAMLSIALQR